MGCYSTGTIQLLRGSHADFVSEDPVVQLGELVYTSNPVTFKIGDGVTNWSDLPEASLGECEQPCDKTFRLYSKTNYQHLASMNDLPARSGLPVFDTQIDVPAGQEFTLTFSDKISSAGIDVAPDDIQINGQKSTIAMIGDVPFASGSTFTGSLESGGRLFVGINDDNYDDNKGYYLVNYANPLAAGCPPTTMTATTPLLFTAAL